MSDFEVTVAGSPSEPDERWSLDWVDPVLGVARASRGADVRWLVVEGRGEDWHVTLDGRRIPVTVRSWRERVLAEAEGAGRAHAGPVTVTATLPGLIVAVAVSEGDEVEEGTSLVTIEAMKMQNEVRAPRGGRVMEISVAAGQAVATGAVLLRLD